MLPEDIAAIVLRHCTEVRNIARHTIRHFAYAIFRWITPAEIANGR